MARSENELQVLNKLGIPSFRNMTKDMVIELVSNTERMDPQVGKTAMKQMPQVANAVMGAYGKIAKAANEAIKENGAMQKDCHATASRIIDAAEAIACDKDFTPIDRLEALKVMDKAAERENQSAEAARKSNEAIVSRVVCGVVIVAAILVSPIVNTRIQIPRAA